MAASPLLTRATLELSASARRSALLGVILVHLCVICISNYLVQVTFTFWHTHIESTWGTFTFPLIFISTDLTVRLIGQREARWLIGCVMLPALLLSYIISVIFANGQYQGLNALAVWNADVARIAFGSFAAYVLGQLMDIAVFARLRRTGRWWYAPTASTLVGSLLDTFAFFSIAFWHCDNDFMASHWVGIACVDYGVKILVGIIMFVPIYGAMLNIILRCVQKRLVIA